MTVNSIRAHMTCDGCGAKMLFDLDPADGLRGEETLFDLCVEACREGNDRANSGYSSAQGDKGETCLCPACTKTVDAFINTDARNATDAEIKQALDAEFFPAE